MLSSERDIKLFEIIANFGGKTYVDVLEKTLWLGKKNAYQQSLNRVRKLIQEKKLLKLVSTGLVSPRHAIVLTGLGKTYVEEEFGIIINEIHISAVTIRHTILEQISWYYLDYIGNNVDRTIVKNWSKNHAHTPDLFYKKNNKSVYVEIETSKKTNSVYESLFVKIRQDEADVVLYIFEDNKKMEQIGKVMPLWDKIYLVSIEELIENATKNKKIGFKSQKDFLKSIQNQKG